MTTSAVTLLDPAPPPAPRRDNGSDTAILVAYMAILIMYSGRRSACRWRRKPKGPQPTA